LKIIRERNRAGILVYKQEFQPELCPHEDIEQINAISHLREHYPQYAPLSFHPTNEGQIPVQYRVDLIKQGLLKGVSDIVVMKSSSNFPAGMLEMKRASVKMSTAISSEQRQILQLAEMDGKFACVCYGAEAFKKAFEDYLGI